MQANYVQRLRLVFSKTGPTRYIGHLDLARTLERSLHRARIPIAYTQGFNRRPRMQLADALPLGITSEAEIADIWLREAVDPQEAKQRIEASMAPGIDLESVREVPISAPALQTQTIAASYRVSLIEPVDAQQLEGRVRDLLEAETMMAEKRGKTYDLRSLVLDLGTFVDGAGRLGLEMRLSLRPGRTGRPDDVLKALSLDGVPALIHRKQLTLIEEPVAD